MDKTEFKRRLNSFKKEDLVDWIDWIIDYCPFTHETALNTIRTFYLSNENIRLNDRYIALNKEAIELIKNERPTKKQLKRLNLLSSEIEWVRKKIAKHDEKVKKSSDNAGGAENG